MNTVAILMSTYNGELYLDKQIESLFKQTCKEKIKLFIRDDGSSDNTFEIIKKWKNKMDISLYKGKNLGPAESFWELMCDTEIEADYFAFCDQDDIWYPEKLEMQIKDLNKDVWLSICNYATIDAEGSIINKTTYKNASLLTLQKCFISGIGQGCAMVFTRELREKIKEVREKINCVPMHDLVITLHALSLGKVTINPEALFQYRIHGNNVVARGTQNRIKDFKRSLYYYKKSSIKSMSLVAKDLLDIYQFNEKSFCFLCNVMNYKKKLASKIKLLFLKDLKNMPKGIKKSFRIRVLVNWY